MVIWVVLAVAGGLLLVSIGQVLVRRFGRDKVQTAVTWGVGVAVAIVLLRVGFQWIVVAISAAVGLRRWLFPLLRLLPVARSAANWAARKHSAPGNAHTQPTRRARQMSRAEALEVLGLQEGATAEEVALAYKNLMVKVHPDQGGSTFLASQVNEARRVLS